MKLIIDYGNTRVKVAIFDRDQLHDKWERENLNTEILQNFLKDKTDVTSAIISAVRKYPVPVKDLLKKRFKFVELSETTPLPLKNKYLSPHTLGKDRIAAAVAANAMFRNQHVLIIDAGTCITYDFIDDKNAFIGGGISPGLEMRFKALHTFTDKLPLVTLDEFNKLIGQNTQESILSGVLNGAVAELTGIVSMYETLYPDIKIILTGGNAIFFDKRVKNNIFVFPNLVLTGLNLILDHNIED
jgi:type III pantothenate kinase